MAIVKLNDFGSGDANLEAIMATLNRAYKGMIEVSLSNFDFPFSPKVESGSIFDVNGALFVLTGDESISGFSSIPVDTEFYVVYDESANGFIYSANAPTWSDGKQGWYNGNDRYLFSLYKYNSSSYADKALMKNSNGSNSNFSYNQNLRTESSPIFAGRRLLSENELDGTYTEDEIFTAVEASQKNKTFGNLHVHGILETSGGDPVHVFGIDYVDSNNYNFKGYNLSLNTRTPITITRGSATNHVCAFSW